jgi:predicted O-methyltransferase YrrM
MKSQLKQLLKRTLKALMQGRWGGRLFAFICAARRSLLYGRVHQRLKQLVFSEGVVLNGPFQGLRLAYTDWPKLLGSYEDELHGILGTILQSGYDQIINVGCAEGYYAVGFAAKLTQARVHCFEINPQGIESCRANARSNNVLDRLSFSGFCDTTELARLDYKHKTLIFCDCEGYEKELLRPEAVPALKRCDILVEVHHSRDPDIAATLTARFRDTHQITRVREQYKDPRKYPQLGSLTVFEQRVALSEDRISEEAPFDMEWLFLQEKSPLPTAAATGVAGS